MKPKATLNRETLKKLEVHKNNKGKSIPKFEIDYGLPVLKCPICDGVNLHQKTTSIFNRKEDEDTGVFIMIDGVNATAIDSKLNPSPRRQGLKIGFTCEECSVDDEDVVAHLNIYQHKGNTHVNWK
jgi:hypothetical protein